MAADVEQDADVNVFDEENNILYELIINAEWQQEPELCTRFTKDRQSSFTSRLWSATERALWTSFRTLGLPIKSSTPCTLPPGLVKLVSRRLNWHLAVSRDGNLVGILQDVFLEIRSRRDDFGTIVARGSVPDDPYPQWRCISWSGDGAMVACSSSNGVVIVFDIFGSRIATINPPLEKLITPTAPVDLSSAITDLIFTDFTSTHEWTHELLAVNYHGTLTSYLLNRDLGHRMQHTFHFSSYYPLGVSSVVYDPARRLFYVGGVGNARESGQAAMDGLTCWRVVDGYPHYKLAVSLITDMPMFRKVMPFYRRWRNLTFRPWNKEQQDGVYKLSLSPGGRYLASIHHSGALCVWDVPSLRQRNAWTRQQQPGHDEVSPESTENPLNMKECKDGASKLIDIEWWADNAMITSRCNGAVAVSSASSMTNLLGDLPEWFEASPQVTAAHDGGFLALECECKYPSLKRRLIASEDEDNDIRDESDEEELSWIQRGSHIVKSALYYATDNERFLPTRKRPRVVHRTYRMVTLKSTTPEQLYARKIDSEEYGEALVLARAYGLDCDLVYQRQWRRSHVSIAAIQDYLSKISKRSWVLHECLERTAEDIDAMRELLEYGLRGTDLHALIAIGNRQDGGRFILSEEEEYEDFNLDPYDTDSHHVRNERKKEKCDQLLSQIDFLALNLDQRELCRARHKLISYLRRLYTYEMILGGRQAAEECFDHKFYGKFRSQNIVEVAMDYARASDWRAIQVLFTYHGGDILHHRLAILANFPETTSPHEYKSLLPEVRTDEGVMDDWEEDMWMEPDWSDSDECRMIVEPMTVDLGAFLYDDLSDYSIFRGTRLSSEILRSWYERRALDIERFSLQVDHSLDLVRLGQERGVQGLNLLKDDLTTMEALVYECCVDDRLTFTKFRSLSDMEKMRLLVSKSSAEAYIRNLDRWVLPFLERRELVVEGAYDSLLHQYVVAESNDDLTLTVLIFETSKTNRPIIHDKRQLLTTALDALYSTTRDDQLGLATRIFECVSSQTKDVSVKLQRQIGEMQKHLHAAVVLSRNDVSLTLSAIKRVQASSDDTKDLFIKLTRISGRRSPAMGECDWWKLLDDLEDLQRECFRAISHEQCLQIFMESLLCSGRLENIQLAGHIMDKSDPNVTSSMKVRAAPRKTRLARDKCIELILRAANEYFDSSANLLDPCINLARACLNLFHEATDSIQEELDLISSLSLLNDFGVNLLPLQVRLCKPRLELLQKALCASQNAYKQSTKLLRLGHLVRIPGETQIDRDGQVLQIIAQAAIKARDFTCANDICQQLIAENYDPVWVVCRDLAQQEEFTDIKAKCDLLSFALTYCDIDMVQPILKARCLLDTQILYESVSTTLPADKITATSSAESLQFSALSALKQTRQLLSTTTKTTKDILLSTRETTKAVLSTITDAAWWQETTKWLQQTTAIRSPNDRRDDENEKFDRQGCHPFYSDVVKNAYVSHHIDLDQCDLDFHTNDLHVNLLHAAKLEELITEGAKINSCTDVLLELGRSTLPKDTALGLAYLLSVCDLSEVSKVLDSLPKTAVTVLLIAYYYALQIYQRLAIEKGGSFTSLFAPTPSKVIDKVMTYIDKNKTSHWSDEVMWLINKMKTYKNLHDDISWAHVLHGLGKGVDVTRFVADRQYKHDTVLGLVMCIDNVVFKTALSLATRYDVPLWDVYMSHTEYVFSSSGLSHADIDNHIAGASLMDTLKVDPCAFADRMYAHVFPAIEGTDYALLLIFYRMFNECGAQTQELSADLHVQLLQKIKSITSELDYKKLINPTYDPIAIISPILTSSNVHQFAKMTNKIPVHDVLGGLTPSSVYCVWAGRLFWEGADTRQLHTTDTPAWLQRYETCLDYLNRLTSSDLIKFTRHVVFQQASRDLLSLETRSVLLSRLGKFCLKQTKKRRPQTSDISSEWKDAKITIDRFANHLESLKSPVIGELMQSEREDMRSYATLFDLSMGDNNKVKELLAQIAADGNSPGLLRDLISLVSNPVWSARSIIRDTLAACVESCREVDGATEASDGIHGSAVTTIRRILTAVHDHVCGGGGVVSEGDVTPLLRSFCADDTVAIQPRLDVLELMEKTLTLSEDDLGLLMLYRTNAVVSHVWPHLQLSEGDVNNNASRVSLFDDLLSRCVSLSNFKSLIRLLLIWPPLQTSINPDMDCWVRTFRCLMLLEVPESISLIITTLEELANKPTILDPACTTTIVSMLSERGHFLEATRALLLMYRDSLHAQLEALIPSLTKSDAENDELCKEILHRHRIVCVAKTPLFVNVVHYILRNPNLPEHPPLESVVRELKNAGYDNEAGFLVSKYKSIHFMLTTFQSTRLQCRNTKHNI